MTVRAVETLRAQAGGDALRLLVVDNGSSAADFAELESRLSGRVELIRWARNRGYGAACNAASLIAAESGIPYVWWLNNDLELEPGAMRRIDGSPGGVAADCGRWRGNRRP